MLSQLPKPVVHITMIALVMAVVVIALKSTGALQRLEWISYDHRVSVLRDDTAPPEDIAVILIDEASLQAMNPLFGRFPWPRSVYADLMEFLAFGDPRAVVFDILFTENERDAPQSTGLSVHDQRLIQATREYGFAYHAAQIIHEQQADAFAADLDRPLPGDFIEHFAVDGARGFGRSANNSYTLPIDGLYQAARGIGVAGLSPDDDGIYRRARLFRDYQGDLFPALSVTALLPELAPRGLRRHSDHLSLGTHRVPMDGEQHYLINYYDNIDAYSISGIFSSLQKIRAGEVEDLIVRPGEFKDKIVFIGASAVGLEDLKATPVASATPGVFIHATVAGNILARDFLHVVSPGVTHAIIVLFSLLTGSGVALISRTLLQLLLPVLLGGAYAAWTYWQFQHNTVYDLSAPLLAIALTWLGTAIYGVVTEGRDKRRIRQMFSQYVSPAILNELMDKHVGELKPGAGQSTHATVLFSDVRGFTSISERIDAEKVVDMLNIHFDAMTDVIFKYHGTLDKFIGDALMAFWGAPIKRPDHATQAVTAAVEMTRRLSDVNKALLSRDYPAIQIGIGINTGNVVLGNLGSVKKLDYTVIGDNVNLASRLEGLTSKYAQPVVISESTYVELDADIPCAVVDRVRVKGKEAPLTIYTPLAIPTDTPQRLDKAHAFADLVEEAFNHYLNRDWQRALAAYSSLPDCGIKPLFMSRCRELLQEAPGAEWDGTTTLTTK
jgi:adenylate cyclase